MMTQQQVLEIVRLFFSSELKVDARHARLTLRSAGANFHRAVVAVDFGPRSFEVEISRYDNRIRLAEITTRRKFRFDHRNPLNGYLLKDERSERMIRTARLDRYYPTGETD